MKHILVGFVAGAVFYLKKRLILGVVYTGILESREYSLVLLAAMMR